MARIRLRSVKLTGFKSFPDEVELAFPGKVSAIIGPNGCGKSNLVDAILWVLGEQSPSLMRLKQMGDVVFSGAASRPASGAAEVTLLLESDDGHWKETDGCLEVRRRVFKTGPSDYRLNGRSVRLKDIFDELAEVGLSTRAYSIIEQGRVGQVLSARPIDRRVLLEEAAGITRYKARKHEAELKLEHTRQNLLRLEDVIGEVKRTLRQIKRQAKQAERHQKLESELRDHLQRLFTIDAHLLDAQRSDVQKRRAQAQNEVAAAAAALAGSDADLGRAREDLETGRSETEDAREEVATLMGSRERLEAFLERSADLLDNLRASLDHTRNESATLRSSRGSLDDRIAEARQRTETLQAELETVRKGVAEAEEAHQKSDVHRAEAEQQTAQQRQALLRTISTLTASRNRLGDLERERDRLAYAVGQLAQDRKRLEERHEELGGNVREAAERSRGASQIAEELASRRRELSDQRARLRHEASSAKQEAESLGHTLWELRHRLQGVEREIARHAAAAEQLGNLAPAEQMAGQLGDYLHPSPELAPVLDRVWREWLELPVVRTTTLSSEQIETLAGLEGRIRLVAAAKAPSVRDLPTPKGAEDLLLQAGIEPEHLGWMARSLPRTLRCNDLDCARELADELPDAVIVCGDGVVRKGRILEPTTRGDRHPGALQLRTMEKELNTEITDVGARTDELTGRHQEAARRLEDQSNQLTSLDAEVVPAEQERARTATVEESLIQELGRVERELDSLATEEDRSRSQSEEIDQRHTRLEEEVSKLEARSVELEQAVEDAANHLAGRREETADALRELDRRRAEARLSEERTEAAQAESARLDEEAGVLEGRVGTLETEAVRLQDQQTGTEEEVVRSRTRLVEEQGLLAAAREHERRLSEKVDEIIARVSKLEKEVRVRRETHDRERESLARLSRSNRPEQRPTGNDSENMQRTSSASPFESLLEAEPEPDDEPEALRTDIEGLRAKIDRLGPVNLLALKELDELEERSSSSSVASAKILSKPCNHSTRPSARLTPPARNVLSATFEQVNEVFAETFSTLFGGGTARLDLVDEDDPLESGIDITAQPPGKKNQSVQLLSGGEKALTALSLLISLFRIKPSPFCILDEVDAPLDDANVERFSDLVNAMTEHTQFVLVTHNRRTMARADLLYGVTMEEPGVSKVVSVRDRELTFPTPRIPTPPMERCASGAFD